MYDHL
jgi:hypothetical protein